MHNAHAMELDPDVMEPPMTRRGRKKVLSAEEALQHRRDCAKRCRKRYKRCELEMAPNTLEHLRMIKVRPRKPSLHSPVHGRTGSL